MPNKIRVLHLRASNFVGGPERQILSYCELQSAAIDQTLGVFVGEQEGQAFLTAAQTEGIDAFAVPVTSRAALRALITYIRDRQIDVICSHGYKADILGLICARATGIKTVPFLRGWTAENRKVRLFESLDRATLRFADEIVCLSQTQANEMAAAGIRKTTIHVVRNACPVQENASYTSARVALSRRFGIGAEDVVIACAGRLSPEKGTRYFLDAAREIAAHFPAARFMVFGDGPLREALQAQTTGNALTERVIFTGLLPDLGALLPGVNLLINPSLAEQAPNVVLEAMAARVPCIATSVGAVSEISGESGALLLVPPANSAAIAAAAKIVLQDRELAAGMAEQAQERIREEYGVERQHADLLHLFECFFCSPKQIANGNQQSAPSPIKKPFVSVVMPVRNEEQAISSVLDALLSQDYDPACFEILVCDGMSEDRTPAIVADYEQRTGGTVRLVQNFARWSSAGRNCGVRNSRGDVIAFIDGHCTLPTRSMFSNIAGLLASTVAEVICRPQPLSANLHTDVQRAICMARASAIGHGRDSTIFSTTQRAYIAPDSSGAIYRREVFDRVGLYDESFDACEDVEFNIRCRKAGMLAYTSPGVLIEYEPRRTLSGLWKQMVRYGRGRARLYAKHPDAFSLSAIAPALFLVLVAVGMGLSPVSLYALAFAGAMVFAYAAIVAIASVPSALKEGPKVGLLTALSFGCIHFGLGYGYLREKLGPRKIITTRRPASVTES